VVLAVDELGGDVDHRVAGEDALLEGLLDALLHRGDELAGMAPPLMLSMNSKPDPPGQRRELDDGHTELAPPARLLLVLAFGLGRGGDRLPVGDLRQ